MEQVRDGSTLRVRLFMPDGEHQIVNIALAGVRSARTSSKQGEPSEPWSEEVRATRHISYFFMNINFYRLNFSPSLVFYNVPYASLYFLCRHLPLRLSKRVQMAVHPHLLPYSSERVC